jgi:hypothetical protein
VVSTQSTTRYSLIVFFFFFFFLGLYEPVFSFESGRYHRFPLDVVGSALLPLIQYVQRSDTTDA